jgi:hypothetical protein
MPFELIAYDAWKKATSSTFSLRSKSLKALDEALQSHDKLKSQQTMDAVRVAFATWKAEKGADYTSSTRNRNGAIFQLERMLAAGGADTDAAFGGGPLAFQERALNARLGILYLFGNLEVETSIWPMIAEGLAAVLSNSLNFAGIKADSGGLGDTTANALGIAQGQIQPTATQVKDVVTAAKRSTAKTPMQQPVYVKTAPPVPPRPARPATATTQAKDPTFLMELKAAVTRLWNKVVEFFRARFTGMDVVRHVAVQSQAIIATIVSAVAENAAPFVAAGIDMAKGIVKMADVAHVALSNWWTGRNVVVAPGHPTTVVSSIHCAMKRSGFEGLWQFSKGAANAGVTGASMGAGALVNLFATLFEAIVRLIYRLIESSEISDFLTDAKTHWTARANGDALVKRPAAFARWFADHALTVPTIGILTLNSGICGDKSVYLSMYTQGDTLRGIGLSDDELEAARVAGKSVEFEAALKHFQAGTKMLDDLKGWGADYLMSSGFQFHSTANEAVKPEIGPGFVGPMPQSKFHESLLTLAASHAGNRSQFWRAVMTVANT